MSNANDLDFVLNFQTAVKKYRNAYELLMCACGEMREGIQALDEATNNYVEYVKYKCITDPEVIEEAEEDD